MLFKLLGAMAAKRWQTATANSPPVPHTVTPIANLTQRSAVDFGAAPLGLILAQGNGSLIQTIANRNMIYAIGTLKYLGHTIYRAYLSQGEGAFLHIAVADSKPSEVLEFRLYQPYQEFGGDGRALFTCSADEAQQPLFANVPREQVAPPDTDAALIWSTWLLENADPNVGGMIGCPTLYGKMTDLDPTTDPPTPYLYQRTWMPGKGRIMPISVVETLLDGDGVSTRISHDMMAYARALKDNTTFEYVLVSAASGPDGASVVYWLGVDMRATDVTVYPPVAG